MGVPCLFFFEHVLDEGQDDALAFFGQALHALDETLGGFLFGDAKQVVRADAKEFGKDRDLCQRWQRTALFPVGVGGNGDAADFGHVALAQALAFTEFFQAFAEGAVKAGRFCHFRCFFRQILYTSLQYHFTIRQYKKLEYNNK